ncbi:MAG: polysaccharide deacetylase family protein [Sediminibacterium sp.]|nr:polysaccharide deacetylase family protein [Sediminibacterium sp.]
MKRAAVYIFFFVTVLLCKAYAQETSWIRINQLGYPTNSIKTAVWCSKKDQIKSFELVDAITKKIVYTHSAGKAFGAYGPFTESYRLEFSSFIKPGKYFLRAGNAQSPVFDINDDVYKGAADFCLRYMRQQRSGFNPFLKDSCHTHDGYTLYGPMPDSTHIDVSGGWHDASDYLQYSTTSANATYHLLAAYRDFPKVFGDEKQANGLDGKNGMADVLDEAKWGLDWLIKMNPRPDWMFNQLGDDRDHMGMRIPKEDNFYGKGFERPVYFVSGKPQQRGKFMNASTGGASTAGKFASAFALGYSMFNGKDNTYTKLLYDKAMGAWNFALAHPGVSQTASVRSPYIYAEDNWVDDMELAAANINTLQLITSLDWNSSSGINRAFAYAIQEPVTPWLGADTAKHYQWYPFVNIGHYELARQLGNNNRRDTIINFYKQGIENVWNKAKTNAFYRGIPFIWCSNNLTTSFATQCYWYEQLTGDKQFAEFQQANFDWLFGCNPWGTSMVYGLPSNGDTPVDPHSAFTHLKNYPIDGGLVDGPVYTSIYSGLIGITLKDADEYAEFQSNLAVYHDDYGDYSTNEPTMDGTASLIYLLAAKEAEANKSKSANSSGYQISQGAVIRGDSTKKEIALVFTGDEFGDGLTAIANTLQKQSVNGSFFFTGRFYRNKTFQPGIKRLYQQKNEMGSHSDMHLLYNDWTKRDSTLVTRDSLLNDLSKSRNAMSDAGIKQRDITHFFIPPYEWWNNETAKWLSGAGMKVFSFTPGTTSNGDYTYPEMGKSYRTSDEIITNIKRFNETRKGGLNGVVLLIHAGTDPRRKDKLYNRLDELISYLKKEGYAFKKVDELLR